MAKTASLFILALLAFAPLCAADSIASKNNKGNRLFEKGSYEDAEKAYVSAQGEDPGKPEVLYNLGNSLIKQKKYREGGQALGQAIRKGDKEIQQKSWYNNGAALFSIGNYRESANAFIEALKLNPSDRDAKYNLELALKRLEQQEQQKSQNGRQKNSQEDKDKTREAQESNSKERASQNPNSQPRSTGEKQPRDQQRQPGESVRHNGSINKEQAMQLLDAVQNQEKEEQRKMLERRAMSRTNGKDW